MSFECSRGKQGWQLVMIFTSDLCDTGWVPCLINCLDVTGKFTHM